MQVISIPAWLAATNAYVLHDGPGGLAVLIDAPPEPDRISEVLMRHDLSLQAILLTHGHVDHTGGSGSLERETAAVVYVHPDDDFLTLHPEDQVRGMFGALAPGSYDLPGSFKPLRHGMSLSLIGHEFDVRQTPGHTPGHCCFHIGAEGVIFSGDQLFAGSVGRTDLPGGSWEQLVRSMREQVMTLDDDVRVLPGHGSETTIGRERVMNPFRAEWAEG